VVLKPQAEIEVPQRNPAGFAAPTDMNDPLAVGEQFAEFRTGFWRGGILETAAKRKGPAAMSSRLMKKAPAICDRDANGASPRSRRGHQAEHRKSHLAVIAVRVPDVHHIGTPVTSPFLSKVIGPSTLGHGPPDFRVAATFFGSVVPAFFAASAQIWIVA